MATDFKQVALSAKITIGDSEFLLVHIRTNKQPKTAYNFKNNKDSGDWEQMLAKLQTKKDLLPKSVMLGVPIVPNATQPNQFAIQQYQLNPSNEEAIFYIQDELNQNQLKKDFVNSKLDDEEKTWL